MKEGFLQKKLSSGLSSKLIIELVIQWVSHLIHFDSLKGVIRLDQTDNHRFVSIFDIR